VRGEAPADGKAQRTNRSFPMKRRGAGVKGPKTVNHPHQVGLGELLSMASTRLLGEVGGPIGLTRPTNKRLLVALFASRAMMLYWSPCEL
jgi:hypothetical protein